MADGFKIADAFVDVGAKTDKVGIGLAGLGGLIAPAVGGALAAVPVIMGAAMAKGVASIVMQNDTIKASWDAMGESFGNKMGAFAAPLIPVMKGVTDQILGTVDKLGPSITKGLITAGPFITQTFDILNKLALQVIPQIASAVGVVGPMFVQMVSGVSGFIGNMIPGLMTAIGAAGPIVGALSTGLAGMGTAVGIFFQNMSVGSAGAATGMTALFGIVNGLLPILGSLFGNIATVGGPVLAALQPVILMLAQAIADNLLLAVQTFAPVLMSLLPMVSGLIPLISSLVSFLIPMAPYLTMIAGGVGAVMKVLQAWTIIQRVLNLVLMANPIGLVVGLLAGLVAALIYAWNNSETFRNIVTGVWNAVKSAISSAVNGIKGFITGMVNTAKGVLNWFGSLPGLFKGWFMGAVSAVGSAASSLIGKVKAIPGQILSALGNLGGMLVGSGRALLEGLWNGISGAVGWVKSKISGALSSIRNLFPFSPAKEGPFSGSGYTTHSGKALAGDFGKGILSQIPSIKGAADAAMRAAQGSLGGSGGLGLAASSSGLGIGLGGSGAGSVTNIFEVTVDAKTVAEMQSVMEFFANIQKTARSGAAPVSGVRM